MSAGIGSASLSLPSHPQMINGAAGRAESGTSSLVQAEAEFMKALKRLEYERAQHTGGYRHAIHRLCIARQYVCMYVCIALQYVLRGYGERACLCCVLSCEAKRSQPCVPRERVPAVAKRASCEVLASGCAWRITWRLQKESQTCRGLAVRRPRHENARVRAALAAKKGSIAGDVCRLSARGRGQQGATRRASANP